MKSSLALTEYPAAGAFMRSYAHSFERVAAWFDYNPHDGDVFSARLAELEQGEAVDCTQAAEAVRAQQERWGTGEEGRKAAALLGQPGTYAVVTGQQVGLFGGPLYTQFKAVSAIKLARLLKQRFPGREFVPTFWMASADSDFEEVRKTYVLDRGGEVAELALPPALEADEGLTVAARAAEGGLDGLLAKLDEVLPGGEHNNEVVAALRQDYAGGGLVTGFARWMARLFRNTGLVIIDPQDVVLASAATGLVKRELEEFSELEDALAARNAEIAAAGFKLQVEHAPGDTNLFLLNGEGRREKIVSAEQGFSLRPAGKRFSTDELAGLAASSPERFVAGVMLRPLYQDMLFPTAAFAGGAAEIAYRAQATALFAYHGRKMAPAYYRASATLIPRKQAALLDELGLELAGCYVPPQDLAAAAVAPGMPEDIAQALTRYKEVVHKADLELAGRATALDPSLEASFETLRGNLLRHLEKLEKKITSSLKRRGGELVSRIARLQTLVYPRQSPQERLFSLLSFLPRYGFGIIDTLLDGLAVPSWEHQIIILD